MKFRFQYLLYIASALSVVACKKDNYKAPTSQLTGRVVYQNTPIQVEYNQVRFELYEFGFGKVGPISNTFTPDGTFSHLLFDGDYKLVLPANQGPWLPKQTGGKPDTISFTLRGSHAIDIEVTPYYMIRTPQIAKSGNNVTGTFKIEKIVTDANARNIEKAVLYINNTQFVSQENNIAKMEIAGSAITDPNNVSLTVAVPNIVPAQNYVFARVAVKIAGVEDMILSPLQKIQL
jgi:hypothetical protein